MKLGFDARENMSMLDYYYAKISKINNLLSMRKMAKNWIEIALFRIGLKKNAIIKLWMERHYR